jgi:hypothetical protein
MSASISLRPKAAGRLAAIPAICCTACPCGWSHGNGTADEDRERSDKPGPEQLLHPLRWRRLFSSSPSPNALASAAPGGGARLQQRLRAGECTSAKEAPPLRFTCRRVSVVAGLIKLIFEPLPQPSKQRAECQQVMVLMRLRYGLGLEDLTCVQRALPAVPVVC